MQRKARKSLKGKKARKSPPPKKKQKGKEDQGWGGADPCFWEKLKGRSLKRSFDKACALTCRFLCRSLPHPPHPLPLFPYLRLIYRNRKTAPPLPAWTRPQTPPPRTPIGTRTPLRKLPPAKTTLVTGKSLVSPEKGNVDKMSKKCPKKCPKIVQSGWKHNFRTFFGQFLPIWSMLLLGDPVQCAPVTKLPFSFCPNVIVPWWDRHQHVRRAQWSPGRRPTEARQGSWKRAPWRPTAREAPQFLPSLASPSVLRVRPPGIEWKTGRNPKMGKKLAKK